MEQEIAVAAKWWADKLRNGSTADLGGSRDKGAALSEMMLLLLKSSSDPIPSETIDRFEALLRNEIRKQIGDNWKPENPEWGAYNRVVSVDYHPCESLSNAYHGVGLDNDMADLPMKTVMRINPGKVTVAEGYGANFVTIYEAGAPSLTADATPDQLAAFMSASTSEHDWNARCKVVKATFGGYPRFWFPAIILSGLAKRTANKWGGDAQIYFSVEYGSPKP